MQNSYTKLKDGTWGIRISGTATAGSAVEITTKAGSRKVETVGRVLWTGDGVSLCSIAQGSGRRPGRAPMGSGHGSAPSVPGYSSYCTDRPGCRCYDCE